MGEEVLGRMRQPEAQHVSGLRIKSAGQQFPLPGRLVEDLQEPYGSNEAR